jgi:hypothetical protein
MATLNRYFKLDYSGNFKEVNSNKLLEDFNLFNIIAIYSPSKRVLYIWIGKRSSQSLKKHIAQVREVFTRDFPELKALRNVIVESGTESDEFFESVGIIPQNFKDHMENQEFEFIPLIAEINRLRDKAEYFFSSENYEDAIQIAEKVIAIAKQVGDIALEHDQATFIETIISKKEAEILVKKLEEECNKITVEFDELIKKKDIIAAHALVKGFLSRHDHKISDLSFVRQLIEKDSHIEYLVKDRYQRIDESVDSLKKLLLERIKDFKFEEAKIGLAELRRLMSDSKMDGYKIEFDVFTKKILQREEQYKNKVKSLIKEIMEKMTSGHISECVEIVDQIIDLLKLNVIQRTY